MASQAGHGAVLASGANSHVDLANVTIVGGLLSTSDGGVIITAGGADVLDGSTFCGAVSTAGMVLVGNRVPLTLQGNIDNTGTIALQTDGGNYFNFSLLHIALAGATLDRSCSIVLEALGNNANEMTGVSTTVAATLHKASTISGVGAIGQGLWTRVSSLMTC